MSDEIDSYFVSLECTPEYNRFWKESHNQTKLGLAAFIGLEILEKEEPEDWQPPDVADLARYIEESVFIRIIDNFQTYVVELIASVFTHRPETSPNFKIDSRAAFEYGDINELRLLVVEIAATKYAYMNIVDLDEELKQKYSYSLFSSKFQKLRVRSWSRLEIFWCIIAAI